MELHETFSAWLAGNEAGAFTYCENDFHHIVIKVQKNNDFDYLYSQRSYRCDTIQRSTKFEYAGIYCRHDDMIYDYQYEIRTLAESPEAAKSLSAKQLLIRMQAEVCEAVEAIIGNDRSKLRVKSLKSQRDLDDLEYVKEHGAASTARDLFLSGVDGSAPEYRCPFSQPCWSEDSLLEYILNPEGYVSRMAAAYISENQDAILLAFLKNDAVSKAYIALAGNTRHTAHYIRKIMTAVNSITAKTVRVTIRKDGKEFTFKTDADDLRRDCGFTYGTWHIAAQDRREFERLFGRHCYYSPEEIMRIEYGRTAIYEAEQITA